MGILNEQPNQQPDQANQQVSQPQSKDEETFRRLGLASMKIIYSKPESDHVLEILKDGANNPVDAVAHAAFAVIKRMQNEMTGINPNLAYSIAPSLIAMIFEMGEAAKIFGKDTFPEDTDPSKIIGETLTVLSELAKGDSTQGQAMQQPIPQAMPQQPAQAMPQGQPMPQQPMGA